MLLRVIVKNVLSMMYINNRLVGQTPAKNMARNYENNNIRSAGWLAIRVSKTIQTSVWRISCRHVKERRVSSTRNRRGRGQTRSFLGRRYLVFCIICQHDLADCTCPDIEERLRSLQEHPAWHIPDCKKCGKPASICRCDQDLKVN